MIEENDSAISLSYQEALDYSNFYTANIEIEDKFLEIW